MLHANVKIIEELKAFLTLTHQTPELRQIFSIREADFSRKRVLTMERLILLIAKLCKKTLSVEVETFFRELKVGIPCTASAFSQQRMKLVPDFFRIWNKVLTESYYQQYGKQVKRWKGYRLIAADGSNVSLVNIPALQEHFGGQRNQECYFVQGKAFGYYDILNSLVLNIQFGPYRHSELSMAYKHVDKLDDDMLTIYDRNFCNYKMIALHLFQEKEKKFVIRGKDHLGFVKDFLRSNKKSAVVYIKPTPGSQNELAKCGYKIDQNTRLKVRLVRVDLPKTTTVLVTNLWEEEGHTNKELAELYTQRWTIETNFSKLKNILQLESFSGQTVQSVYQDFYASILINNLHSLLIKDAQHSLDTKESKWKYPIKVNNNKSYGFFRATLVELFLSQQPLNILKKLHDYFIRSPVPVRKGRSFPRCVKNKQSKSKHKTHLNYKPAF